MLLPFNKYVYCIEWLYTITGLDWTLCIHNPILYGAGMLTFLSLSCGQDFTFNTSTKTTGLINRDSVLDQQSSSSMGSNDNSGGFNSLESLYGILNIPVMTERYFIHQVQSKCGS